MNLNNKPTNTIYATVEALRKDQTFDSFIVDDSNSLARASLLAALEDAFNDTQPSYNPLVITGDSGVGKSHLLNAAAMMALSAKPDVQLIHTTCEAFTIELLDSCRSSDRSIASVFHNKYKNADILLMDDIDLLEGRIATQSEFLHIIKDLYQNNAQLIFTSRKDPKDLNDLSNDLKAFLCSAMIARINIPSTDFRIEFLRKKSAELGLSLDKDIISYLAAHCNTNIRPLEGSLKLLKGIHELLHKDITMELVRETFGTEGTVSKNSQPNSKRRLYGGFAEIFAKDSNKSNV